MDHTRCEILLPTYNNEQFLEPLLDSLISQDDQDFFLTVRDDGSTDRSREILQDYRPRFAGRMRIIEDSAPTGSAMANYSILMRASRGDQILFCDADDVWKPNKVRTLRRLLLDVEAASAPGVPVYVFTDVIPVDIKMNVISESYWSYKRIDPSICTVLSRSLICPPMLGCASALNRALVDMAAPVPATVTGHDWWALLIACALGKVAFTPERTLYYRIHGANASSPQEVNLAIYVREQGKITRVRHGIRRRAEQAGALLSRFGPQMPPPMRAKVTRFARLPEMGFWARRWALMQGGHFYPDLPRNLATLAAM